MVEVLSSNGAPYRSRPGWPCMGAGECVSVCMTSCVCVCGRRMREGMGNALLLSLSFALSLSLSTIWEYVCVSELCMYKYIYLWMECGV